MGRCSLYILFATSLFLSPPSLASGIQSRALSLFLKTLNSKINGSLDARSIEFKPPSTVVFENASLKTKSGKELIRVKKVTGTFSLSALFLGSLKFDTVDAISPEGILQIRNGDLDLLEVFGSKDETKDSAKNAAVSFRRVNVSLGKVTLKIEDDFTCHLNELSFQSAAFDTDFRSVKLNGLKTHYIADTIPLSALLDGKLDVDFNKGKLYTRFLFSGRISNFSLYDVKIKDRSNFNASALLSKKKLEIKDARIDNAKLRFKARGDYDIEGDKLALSLSSFVKDSQDLFPPSAPELHFHDIELETTFRGPFKYPVIDTRGHGQWGNADLTGKVRLDARTKRLDGNVELTSSRDLSLRPILDDDYFLSKATGSATIAGTLDNVIAKGKLRFGTLYSANLSLLSGEIFLSLKDKTLSIDNGIIQGSSGALTIQSFGLHFPSKRVWGNGFIQGIDLLPAIRLPQENSKTLVDASLRLEGNLPIPKVTADGHIYDAVLRGQTVGDLPFVATYGQAQPHVFEFSGELNGELGKLGIRSAIDTRSKETNTLLEVSQFKADASTNYLSPWIKFGPSFVNGRLEVQGPLSNPSANVALSLEADFADPEMAPLSAQLNASISAHELVLNACASIDHVYVAGEVCGAKDTLVLRGSGSFHNLEQWQINYQGQFEAERAETMSEFLHNEFILLNLGAEISGIIIKRPGKDLTLSLSADVNRLVADFPDIPIVRLEKPFVLKWSKDSVSISPKAVFSLAGGELAMAGKLEKGLISAELVGEIPLLFSRLLSKNIVEASGLAFGQIALSGSKSRPSVNGKIVPDKGSSIRLRALPDDIVFKSGEIRSTLDPSLAGRLHTEVDNLHFNMGNSDVSLNGDMNLNLRAEKEADILQEANFALKGNDLSIVLTDFSFEGDIDLRLQTLQNTHWLFGKATIESGRFIQNFSLKNFQFEALARPGSNFQLPAFFTHFESNFNVDIAAIDLESNLAVFDFSGGATGALNVVGDFYAPRINGFLELADSEFKFPSVTFEIPSTVIRFRNSPDKAIDPEIHLKATAELLGQEFGLTTDTIVELSLDGDFDHLNLDLRSIAGDRRLDRTKILLLLLNSGTGSSNASSLLLKPLTSELETLISDITRTRFRIGSAVSGSGLTTSVQWRLNPRLDLEGSASFGTGNLGLQDARFKLLLFDHLPIGRELFLEGIFFTPATQLVEETTNSQTLRLTYRLLEQ